MLKLTATLNRRAQLSLEAFSEHWRTIHRAHALKLVQPGIMLGYVQNHRLSAGIPGLPAPGDGVPEVWVPSADAVQQLATCSEYLEGAWLDEPNFMTGRSQAMLGVETVLVANRKRRDAVRCAKFMLFAKRSPMLTLGEFAAEISARYATLWEHARPLRHSYEIAMELPSGLEEQPYDLIASLWWDDRGSFDKAWTDFSLSRAGRLLDITRLQGLMVREEPVLWPQAL